MWLLLTLPGEAVAPVAGMLPEWILTWIDKPIHFLLFAVLGWLLRGSLSLHLPGGAGALVAVVAGCAYGALTEWVQLSVPGRSGELADLIINGLGTMAGVVVRGHMTRFPTRTHP